MTDEAAGTQPSKPFHGTFADEVIDIPKQTGFVVHLVTNPPQGHNAVWAWCLVVEGTPGYSSVTYTGPDGVTAADVSGFTPLLGPVQFKVFC